MFAEKQFYTLIIAPARSSQWYKIILQHRHLYALGVLSITGVLIVTTAAIWLVKQAVLLVNYHRVQGENRALRAEFSTTLHDLRSRLNLIEKQSQQLTDMAKEMGMEVELPSVALQPEMVGTGGPADLQSFASELQRVEAKLKELHVNFVTERVSATPSGWPTEGRMTGRYGVRHNPFGGGTEFHAGQDISAPHGQPVHATARGVVAVAAYRSGYGNLVILEHGQGITTFYAHMASIYVQVGDRVDRGHEIGTVGATGRASGTHVHYEVRVDDRPVDPSAYSGN
ncbi:MAG: M23 family metallopeptidase [Acidobacteria bacterium]|nr:M23 family metallopeptidase [Acidobacteriota bacterium]